MYGSTVKGSSILYSRSKPCVVVAEYSFYKGKNERQHTVYTLFTTAELPYCCSLFTIPRFLGIEFIRQQCPVNSRFITLKLLKNGNKYQVQKRLTLSLRSVLWIRIMLMRIRIRESASGKTDPDPNIGERFL